MSVRRVTLVMASLGLVAAWSGPANAANPVAVNDSYNTSLNTPLVVPAPGVLANDSDADGNAITAALVNNAAHGTVVLSPNGSFTYTPSREFSGTDTFTYRARDSTGKQSNTATVTITVSSPNVAPVAANDSYSTNEDTTLNVPAKGVLANDTDANGDSLTAALVGNVAHGTLSLNANGSFSYTPAANYNGSDSFTYRANDGSLNSNTATVTIAIAAVNDPPVATNDAYSTPKNTALTVNAGSGVLANDSDPDGDALTAVLVGNPAHGTLTLFGNGAFTYTPTGNYTGPDSFTYRANDGTLNSNTATVSITVTKVNTPPVAVADSYSTNEDTTLNVPAKGVLANDTDVDGDALSAVFPTNPSHGTLTLNSDGSFSYTPAANYNGPDSFTYRANDGAANSDPATVSITVVPVNDPPVAVADSYTTVENTPLAVPAKGVLANDTDVDGDALTAILVAGPAHGIVALKADGSFTYTPTLLYSGPDSFTYRANDGKLNSDPATVAITVTPAPHADLAISLTASPNPVVLGATATWTFTIKNNASAVDVPGVTFTATFAGEVPFQFDAPSDPGCTISIAGSATQLSCTLGSIVSSMTRTVKLTGHGGFAGDVFANARVAIAAPVPIDDTPANDTTTTALSVAQRVSSGPAQILQGVDARAIAAGDFNGDGFVDLAVATGPDQGTEVFLNMVDPANANRRVLSSVPIAVGAIGPSNAIAVADLNGDKALDIVTAGGAGFASHIYLNSGPAAFTAKDIGDVSQDSHAVAVGDVNGDGLPDIVFANYGATTVYTNRGSGVFELTDRIGSANSRGVLLVDLFGDSLPELVLANANGDVTIYRNTAGAFTLELTLPTGPTTSVATADFDGDKRADLVFGRDSSTLPAAPSGEVWLNTSTTAGSFFLSDQLGASLNAAVGTADIDLNGSADVVVVDETGADQVYANSGTSSGTFNLFPQQLGLGGAQSVATGKFSVDDRVDVALGGPSGIAIFYNDGAGNLGGGDVTAPTITMLGSADVTMNVGDTYSDAGATATDAQDGDLTAKIVATNPVNTAQVGTYTVTYNVKDSSGNSATPVTRTVHVQANGGSTGGGGATGFEFLLGLALAMIAARLQWRARGTRP